LHLLNYDLIITNIVTAVNVPQGTGKRVHKNRPSHGFAYNYGGDSLFRFQDGCEITLRAGECIYLPMGSGYIVDHYPGSTSHPNGCVAVNFALNAPLNAPPFKLKIANQQQFLALFQAMIRLWKQKSPGYREQCLSELYRLLAILRELHTQQYASSRAQSVLQPAVDYIAAHHTKEAIPTALLAEKCGVSESYLRKLFQRLYGISPMEYARQMRLSYARELLGSGECTVSAAAELSGFRDGSYFSREFKKMYKTTPAAYLKSCLSQR